MNERCVICDCILRRIAGTYARPSAEGRSHATKHHFVAERFFGRSSNRRGTVTDGVFSSCPWGHEGETAVFCYECHEDLLHNPVLLTDDFAALAALVERHGLTEEQKPKERFKTGVRVQFIQLAEEMGPDSHTQEEAQVQVGGKE